MLDELLTYLAFEPFSPHNNFVVAEEYFKAGQLASAVSFYLRTIEFGKDSHPEFVYASLLRLAKCFDAQNNRLISVKNALLQALAYNPERPEAYFWLARFHRKNANWQEAYTFAVLGKTKKRSVLYAYGLEFEDYSLEYEQAVSGWWIGRREESRWLFNQLLSKDLTPEYRKSVEDNIALI